MRWPATSIDVRFGSIADITPRARHVRFTPDSGHSSVQVVCPLSAKSGHQPSPVERGRYSLEQTVSSEDNARFGSLADTRDQRCPLLCRRDAILCPEHGKALSDEVLGARRDAYILVSSIKGSSSVYLNPHRRPFPSWRSTAGTAHRRCRSGT